MSDWALRKESIQEVLDFEVLTSEFSNGAEQRRLAHENKVIGFKIKSPPLTYTQYQDYRTSFLTNYGALTAFTFTSPFDQTEYNVRYVPKSFTSDYAAGAFSCSFELKVLSET